MQPWHIKAIAVGCCTFFLVLNAISVKHVGIFQILLVVVLLLILAVYIGWGFHKIDVNRFEGYLSKGWASILATSGLVFISFGGLTKIASIAEEVKSPARISPRA